jgi:hypothetical protein
MRFPCGNIRAIKLVALGRREQRNVRRAKRFPSFPANSVQLHIKSLAQLVCITDTFLLIWTAAWKYLDSVNISFSLNKYLL